MQRYYCKHPTICSNSMADECQLLRCDPLQLHTIRASQNIHIIVLTSLKNMRTSIKVMSGRMDYKNMSTMRNFSCTSGLMTISNTLLELGMLDVLLFFDVQVTMHRDKFL